MQYIWEFVYIRPPARLVIINVNDTSFYKNCCSQTNRLSILIDVAFDKIRGRLGVVDF